MPLPKTKIKDPVHILLNQQDLAARAIVDHRSQFTSPPKDVRPDSKHYYKNVINGASQKIANQGEPGAAPKVFIGTEDGTKYMIKPYHEGIHPRTAPYMRYPIQGWSEIASQALYHAGGIGHLCSRSHVALHTDMQKREHPVVAVKLDPFVHTTIDHMAGYNGPEPHHLMKNAFLVGMMDFLTNHNDRHENNLLFEPVDIGAPQNLLAVDNGSAFQYKTPNRFDRMHDRVDNLYYYLADSRGMRYLTNPQEGRYLWSNEYVDHGKRWWKENGDKIREELDKQLKSVRHPRVREYIKQNFDQRAGLLDNFAEMPEVDSESYDPYIDGENSHVISTPILKFQAKRS